MARKASDRERSVEALSELVEHLGRVILGAGYSGGLKPAQWSALRFLTRANPSARSLSGFVKFHAASRGSAAQTLRALRAKGLVTQQVSSEDRRVKYCAVTTKGERLMEQDPLRPLATSLAQLSDRQLADYAELVKLIIGGFFSLSPIAEDPKPRDKRRRGH